MIVLPVHKRRSAGFTLLEIMIVVLIISVVLMIAVPSWLSARSRSNATTCTSQLRQINYAKLTWVTELKKSVADAPPAESDLQPYLKGWPECPSGGKYTIGNISIDPICSIGDDHIMQ